MTPPDRPPAADPHAWLDHARSNLVLAKNRIPGVRLGDLCFNAQQAAEKALKGLLASRKADVPLTHDLSHVLAIIEDTGIAIPVHVLDAARLSPYAVGPRYPETETAKDVPVSATAYAMAVDIAERVIEWVESVI